MALSESRLAHIAELTRSLIAPFRLSWKDAAAGQVLDHVARDLVWEEWPVGG